MKTKKVLALVLAAIMVLGLAACGNKEPANTDPIKVGVYLPLTGSGAAVGDSCQKAINLLVEEFNAAGGVGGRNVELVVYDDAGTTEGAVKAVQRLIDQDEVQVILGDYLSANMSATYQYTEDAKVLQVGIGTSAAWTNIGLEYLYRGTAPATGPIGVMVEEVADYGAKTVAIITSLAEYGVTGKPIIEEGIAALGNVEIVSNETYQANETEFSGLVTKVLATKPEAIMVYGVSTELPQLFNQIRQQGFKGLICTSESGTNKDIIAVAGSGADGLALAGTYFVVADMESCLNDMQTEFVSQYLEAYGEYPPKESTYRAYDAMKLIIEALSKAEDPDSGESIKDAFKAIKGFETMAGTFDYTAGNGEGLAACNKFMIMDGKLGMYDKDALLKFYGK